MPIFDPPIQQDEVEYSNLGGIDFSAVHPRGKLILGKPIHEEWNKVGAIFLPGDIHKEYQNELEVLAIGPKVEHVKKGEIVMIGPYRTADFGSHVLFNENDIRLIMSKGEGMNRPIGDRVLLLKDERKDGLFLTDEYKATTGKVRSVGEDVTEIQDGDHVVFSWDVGNDIKIEGKQLTLMREDDVGGIIEPEEKTDVQSVS